MIEHDPLVCGIAEGDMPIRCSGCYQEAVKRGCKPNSASIIRAAALEEALLKKRPFVILELEPPTYSEEDIPW